MYPVYSFLEVATARTARYTVPAGKRLVMRNVIGRNNHIATNTLYIYKGSVMLRSFNALAARSTAGDWQEWDSWVVFAPGDTLELAVSNAGGVYVTVSGSLYTI